MTTSPANDRKASDQLMLKLNSVGLSMHSIGTELGVHPTTVTMRLRKLKVAPSDTRRSFMEDIWNELTPQQQEWVAAQVDGGQSNIRELVKGLIVSASQQDNNLPGSDPSLVA